MVDERAERPFPLSRSLGHICAGALSWIRHRPLKPVAGLCFSFCIQ